MNLGGRERLRLQTGVDLALHGPEVGRSLGFFHLGLVLSRFSLFKNLFIKNSVPIFVPFSVGRVTLSIFSMILRAFHSLRKLVFCFHWVVIFLSGSIVIKLC